MNKKRAKTISIVELPLDCWCQIIKFHDDTNDFINLVCCVKGLYEYVKRIYPKCTENLLFHLHAFPQTRQDHATNLSFLERYNYKSQVPSILEFIKVSGFSNYESFFENIFQKFPNLIHLNLRGCREMKEINLSGKMEVNIVSLSIGIVDIDFFCLDYNFPKLRKLKLEFDTTLYSYEQATAPAKINYSKLPKLNELRLAGWKTEISEEIKPKLEILDLKGCNIPKTNCFTNFTSIKKFVVASHFPCFLPMDIWSTKLECLHLYFNSKEMFESWKEIKNFSFLKKLTVRTEKTRNFEIGRTKILHISNLPNLEELDLRIICQVKLENLRELKHLSYSFSEIVIPNPSKDTPNMRHLQSFPRNRNSDFSTTEILECWKNSLEFVDIVGLYPEGGYRVFSFRGFKNLKTIKVEMRVEINQVKDCPKLEVLYLLGVKYAPTFVLKNLPKLRKLSLVFEVFNKVKENLRKIFQQINENFGLDKPLKKVNLRISKASISTNEVKNIKRMRFMGAKSIEITGDAINDSALEELVVREESIWSTRRCGSVVIQNLLKLRSIRIESLKEKFTAKDCFVLEEINLGIESNNVVVHLEGLKHLKSVNINPSVTKIANIHQKKKKNRNFRLKNLIIKNCASSNLNVVYTGDDFSCTEKTEE